MQDGPLIVHIGHLHVGIQTLTTIFSRKSESKSWLGLPVLVEKSLRAKLW